MAASSTKTPHVVILGAGFGGLAAASRLCGSGAKVTIVDRQNHHVFQPLLYQVATAGLRILQDMGRRAQRNLILS